MGNEVWKADYYRRQYYFDEFFMSECSYRGRMYFFRENEYLCSSDLEGNDIRILVKLWAKEYEWDDVLVNEKGIFVYGSERNGDPLDKNIFLCYDFQGNQLGKGIVKGQISQIRLHEKGVIFFVRSQKVSDITSYEDNGRKDTIEKLMLCNGEFIASTVYDLAKEVKHLSVYGCEMSFYARYYNKEYDALDDYLGDDTGWMVVPNGLGAEYAMDDLEWPLGSFCLSNPFHSAEDVMTNPQRYNLNFISDSEVEKTQKAIVMVDLARGIFWTEREETDDSSTIKYWEPRKIEDYDNDSRNRVKNMPVWKLKVTGGFYGNRREYFDGEHHYFSSSYFNFSSSDPQGNIYNWSGSSHGTCDKFRVAGGCLFLDLEGYDEQQYDLTLQKSLPLRKSWTNIWDLDPSVITEYEKRKSSKAGVMTDLKNTDMDNAFGGWQQTDNQAISDDLDNFNGGYLHEEDEEEEEDSLLEPGEGEDIWDDWGEDSGDEEILDTIPLSDEDEILEYSGTYGSGSAPSQADLEVIKTIGETDVKYNICTFGAKFHIGFGIRVTIRINGRTYAAKTHNSVKGRIDGMKKLYEENGISLGSRLCAKYYEAQNLVTLEML